MKNRKITYGIKGMMTQQVILRAGKTIIKLTFADGSITATGSKPATFTTDNFMLQHIIENSDLFKKGLIYRYRVLLLNENVNLESNPVPDPNCHHHHHHHGHTFEQCPAPSEPDAEVMIPDDCGCTEEIESEVETEGSEPAELTEVSENSEDSEPTEDSEAKAITFTFNDEARDYLEENYQIPRSKLKTRNDIIDAAKNVGLTITFG